LVNINVGSLRGTSGDDGTISWPFSAKKSKNFDLISLTPLMFIQSEICPGRAANSPHSSGGTLLDKVAHGVQKLCRQIIGLPQHTMWAREWAQVWLIMLRLR
jgi:hypothetical protein